MTVDSPSRARAGPQEHVDRALGHSVRDGGAHAVMTGAGESYLSAFAIHLKATEPQIAFMVGFPPLLGAFSQLLAARMRFRGAGRRRLILSAALLQALVWLPLAALALWWAEAAIAILVLILLKTVYFTSGSITAPHWNAMMRELVPVEMRGRYFSRRIRVTTIASFLALLAAGLVLELFRLRDAVSFGFALLFTGAFAARMVSIYHLAKMGPVLDARDGDAPAGDKPPSISEWWSHLRDSRFSRFLFFSASLQAWVAVAAPLFAVHMLRDLQFSFIEYTLVMGAAVAGQFLTMNAWGRVADAFGNRLIMIICACVIPLFPTLWLLSDAVAFLFCVQLLSGVTWGGFNLSLIGFQYDLGDGNDMPRLVSTYNAVVAAAIFVGALFGGWLAVLMPSWSNSDLSFSLEYPLFGVFVVSTLGRAAVVALLLPRVPEVRKGRRVSLQRFLFRFTRYSPVSGFIYDIVSVARPSAKRRETNRRGR